MEGYSHQMGSEIYEQRKSKNDKRKKRDKYRRSFINKALRAK